MPRKKVKKRPSTMPEKSKLPGIARPDWAWFTVNVGTDHPHRVKKGKGSYTRKKKHPGQEGGA